MTPTAVAGCGQTITSQVIGAPSTKGFRTPVGMVAVVCFFSVGLLVLALRVQRRNWSVVFALLAFAFLLTCVACGSGGSSPSTGGGGSTNGVLPGFNAGIGYDRATGLGTVNAFNLVNNW